jgi:hypothetical protein
LQIPNLESLIAARAGFPNPEQQSCRGIFCQHLVTTLKPDFLGHSGETVAAATLQCCEEADSPPDIFASGKPLCIVSPRRDDLPFSSIRFGSSLFVAQATKR